MYTDPSFVVLFFSVGCCVSVFVQTQCEPGFAICNVAVCKKTHTWNQSIWCFIYLCFEFDLRYGRKLQMQHVSSVIAYHCSHVSIVY